MYYNSNVLGNKSKKYGNFSTNEISSVINSELCYNLLKIDRKGDTYEFSHETI